MAAALGASRWRCQRGHEFSARPLDYGPPVSAPVRTPQRMNDCVEIDGESAFAGQVIPYRCHMKVQQGDTGIDDVLESALVELCYERMSSAAGRRLDEMSEDQVRREVCEPILLQAYATYMLKRLRGERIDTHRGMKTTRPDVTRLPMSSGGPN